MSPVLQSSHFPRCCLEADEGSVSRHFAAPIDSARVRFQYLRQLPDGFLVGGNSLFPSHPSATVGRLNNTLDSIPSFSTAAKVNIVGTGSLKPLKKECYRDSNIKCLPLVVEYR
ncbi:unnamed protein product [Rangifer tarandus platyrhynchus]|uniref:Uncharacterized protein n=2 Tax=Rangifer tarandus platyrhynchus TaxID=3082113 RepID=A0AC59Y0N4_RANTA|nr:unnamed protein product [Rangifer tarandus platyrhynchus]